MKRRALVIAGCLALATSAAIAQEGAVPTGIPRLDHVFVIMMENHGYSQILKNPNAPFINKYAQTANLATNYFAVAHPSLTNYLEVVGGSNFGVLSDNASDWHNATCMTNLATGVADTDNPPSGPICPITGSGTDAATPAIDMTNETQGPPGDINIDGTASYPAVTTTLGITIAEQLVTAGKTWKSYQENISANPDKVNYSDGVFTNLTDFTKIKPVLNPPLTNSDIVQLYAAKHNPFVYFQDIQQGNTPQLSYSQMADFEGSNGLYADLRSGKGPNFSFIAPNQCNDQHGRGNAGPFCLYDPNDNGGQAGLNPALIQLGDHTVQRIVSAIHSSPVWTNGSHTAIVVVWDENDYSVSPITNQVVTIVDTNYGVHPVQSGQFYTHFSLLRSLEGGLGLPCLNHACDASTAAMADLFAAK